MSGEGSGVDLARVPGRGGGSAGSVAARASAPMPAGAIAQGAMGDLRKSSSAMRVGALCPRPRWPPDSCANKMHPGMR